ncbi:tetratricopeptide repeat protein [Pedobacter frigoris]|uniref:Tetratricopeptide repeat protein n=1 Tax=Pedobacter frigoris TaxID=2571272 RepID=A0A4U1CKH3_9SPHI|nr:tetratricopeptide repeat protein [Pedobacter frigoris]TKC05919.1 tetratricopeptide repeat protein [Pedobacter frigoris]
MKKTSLILFILLCTLYSAKSQSINPDETAKVQEALATARQVLLQKSGSANVDIKTVDRMLQLGLWNEAKLIIDKHKGIDYQLLLADYLILNNDFKGAEKLVNATLKQSSKNEKALLLKGFLEIQAWRLKQAAEIAQQVIKNNVASEAGNLLLGRVRLLQKDYKTALTIAKKVAAVNPKSAGSYLLEADVYFWDQHPEQAEKPLIKSLELDPFNADARFSYGYAIWRRIDATQLNAMAAQWDLALNINPLHYQTHWHWGNGHTNLTYADYAEKDDETIRKELGKADSLVASNDIKSALDFTSTIQQKYPRSVLPLMHRASIYYSAFDQDRKIRLDSAEILFKKVLSIKKHYGPAHNGLSAVIKSKRIPYLQVFDSISNVLNITKIADLKNFLKVFPDVAYYPGETAKAMVWNQMYTSVVYFPFLSRQNNNFRIPPLHHDLAITMRSPSFRYMTTFDNRQWMDIRGVGSGAAAMEYVERGAFLERNVVLHEYVHLFHGTVLTDAENRQIRKLYYNAMKEKRTLDYYSQNNESEYFAQTYPAYFEPVKVHPLDFKSMNTTSDLKAKDPDMYHFLDQLVKKERAYLAGDKKAMASNWAEVYLNLSKRYGSSSTARNYLDTALTYDDKYLPAYLAMSNLFITHRDLAEAEKWLLKAKSVNPAYAPIYVSYAALIAARYQAKEINQQASIKQQADYLQQALKLEDDYQELARVNGMLRELYKRNAMLAEAIKVADQYVKTGARVSTYLRDRIDDASAFSAALKAEMGDKSAVAVLKNLVAQKPQNFEYRNLYADALAVNGQYAEAINTLKEAQRILTASGNARSDYNLRISDFYHLDGNRDSAMAYLNPFLNGKSQVRGADQFRYVNLLIKTGNKEKASELLKDMEPIGDNFYVGSYWYALAKLQEANGQQSENVMSLEKAIAFNPYHIAAYRDLISYLKTQGQELKVEELQKKMNNIFY